MAADRRRLKVGLLSRPCASRGYVSLPLLRVAGKWLESAGFRIGDTVSVCVESGRLVLTRVEKEISR